MRFHSFLNHEKIHFINRMGQLRKVTQIYFQDRNWCNLKQKLRQVMEHWSHFRGKQQNIFIKISIL